MKRTQINFSENRNIIIRQDIHDVTLNIGMSLNKDICIYLIHFIGMGRQSCQCQCSTIIGKGNDTINNIAMRTEAIMK